MACSRILRGPRLTSATIFASRREPRLTSRLPVCQGCESAAKLYTPARGQFAPVGKWQQSYAMYLLTGPPLMVGTFSMKRTPNGSQGFELDVMTQRRVQSGFSHFQRATMQCRANALATPSSWVFETKMAKAPDDKPYLQSGRTRNASVADSTLVVRDGARVHKTPSCRTTPTSGPSAIRTCPTWASGLSNTLTTGGFTAQNGMQAEHGTIPIRTARARFRGLTLCLWLVLGLESMPTRRSPTAWLPLLPMTGASKRVSWSRA